MKIRILTPLKHDGKNYAAEEILELPDADATALIECGAASPSMEKVTVGASPKKQTKAGKTGKEADSGNAATEGQSADAGQIDDGGVEAANDQGTVLDQASDTSAGSPEQPEGQESCP